MTTTTCRYCHGKTESDRFGNCAACGAPRIEQEAEVIDPVMEEAIKRCQEFAVQNPGVIIEYNHVPYNSTRKRIQLIV